MNYKSDLLKQTFELIDDYIKQNGSADKHVIDYYDPTTLQNKIDIKINDKGIQFPGEKQLAQEAQSYDEPYLQKHCDNDIGVVFNGFLRRFPIEPGARQVDDHSQGSKNHNPNQRQNHRGCKKNNAYF